MANVIQLLRMTMCLLFVFKSVLVFTGEARVINTFDGN